jgi:hypothetical protein
MAYNYVQYGSRGIELPRNRALDTRRDDDNFTVPSITIYDIDYSILWFLKNKIAPEIIENGNVIPVPIILAAGETWSQIQRHGYLRSKDRKLMTPIITLKRNSIVSDTKVPKLDVPTENNATQLILFPDTQSNNSTDWINKSYNTKESKTYFVSVIPDHVIVSYDLYIWTDLSVQMNSIIEQIIPQDKMPWGDIIQFTTKVGDFNFETINTSGEDRIVRCQIPLEVDGILQAEYELKESSIRKAHTIKRVDFKNEVEQDEIYVDHKPKIIRSVRSRRPSKNF